MQYFSNYHNLLHLIEQTIIDLNEAGKQGGHTNTLLFFELFLEMHYTVRWYLYLALRLMYSNNVDVHLFSNLQFVHTVYLYYKWHLHNLDSY